MLLTSYAYSSGGLTAVIFTDVLQCVIMIIGAIVLSVLSKYLTSIPIREKYWILWFLITSPPFPPFLLRDNSCPDAGQLSRCPAAGQQLSRGEKNVGSYAMWNRLLFHVVYARIKLPRK